MTQQLTFNGAITRIPITISIQSDTIDEDDETFQAVLSQDPVTSTVTIDPAMAVVTITDDDGKND